MKITEYQKKVYLVVGMTVLGSVLLFTLNAFKKTDTSPNEHSIKNGSVVSKEADFTITLDTLNARDRKAFYQKDRDQDTVLVRDPFRDKDKVDTKNKILDMTTKFDEPITRTKRRKAAENDLWDMDNETEPSNLRLSEIKPVETETERRQKLLEANKQQRALYTSDSKNEDSNNTVSFNAAIYRDQFILPGDDVELIITEDVNYKGKLIPKNTIVFATASINKNRVLLEINNVNHVPVSVIAKDLEDGKVGIKSKRAGQLWNDAAKQLEGGLIQDVTIEASQESGRIGRRIARTIGSIFRKKGYKKTDKILLVSDHQVILTVQKN